MSKTNCSPKNTINNVGISMAFDNSRETLLVATGQCHGKHYSLRPGNAMGNITRCDRAMPWETLLVATGQRCGKHYSLRQGNAMGNITRCDRATLRETLLVANGAQCRVRQTFEHRTARNVHTPLTRNLVFFAAV